MTVSYPYSLAFFADKLDIASVIWDIQRNDEMSGTGDGRVWQAELAPPLWIGTVTLNRKLSAELKQIAAMVRKLHGAQEALMLYDPLSRYPQYDPTGSILGSSVVTIGSIAANRSSLSLVGLPANYRITVGDKMSIAFGAGQTKFAFLEASETITANGSGTTTQIAVFPFVPTGVAAGAEVVLKKPACKCIIVPGSHNPGTAAELFTDGAGFKVIQKK
ncbi:hypothetical protein LJR235_002874 [Pararhizobium sp. LjRoot235]|uniref:hypothetical protein n=1 Tax=Pararhizobium sp. LjRoot235 TaxID=3342291 RepID=UPI003ECD1311